MNTLSFFHSLLPSLRHSEAKSGSKLVSQQSFSFAPAEPRSLGGDNQCQSMEQRDTERTAGCHVPLTDPKRRSEMCKHRNVSVVPKLLHECARTWLKPRTEKQKPELLISWKLQNPPIQIQADKTRCFIYTSHMLNILRDLHMNINH